MTATVFNTKTKEVDKKIPELNGFVKKTNYVAKILEIQRKYFTTSDYNKFTSNILVKNFDLNTKLARLETKAELKAE